MADVNRRIAGMRFRTEPRRLWNSERSLVYRAEEYSFDVEPHCSAYAAVVVNDLSLWLDAMGKVVTVSGYCPHPAWRTASVVPPSASPLDVYSDDGAVVQAGLAWSADPDRRWPVFVDRQSGWVCLASGRSSTCCAEVLAGVVLGLDVDQQLADVHLKPTRLPPPTPPQWWSIRSLLR